MGQVSFDFWLSIPLMFSHDCTVSVKQWKKFWANWSKRTIKFLFYLLSWSLIIQAGRVEFYFIAIDTSTWSFTRVNIIRIILEALPCRFQPTWKCSVATILLDVIHWSSNNIIWINARHGWNQCLYLYLVIRVPQTAGEFGQGGEKSKDTALVRIFFIPHSVH